MDDIPLWWQLAFWGLLALWTISTITWLVIGYRLHRGPMFGRCNH